MKEEEKRARQEEIGLALGWMGNIKKAFQKEQTRLRRQGVIITFKPVWQSINDAMYLEQKRSKKLKSIL